MIAASARPQSVPAAGTWIGELQGPGGVRPVTLALNVNGTDLIGTLREAEGSGWEVQGEADGARVSFRRTAQGIAGAIGLIYVGEVDGDRLILDVRLDIQAEEDGENTHADNDDSVRLVLRRQ